jgi:lipid-A-disaccharide synthase
MSQAPLIFLIAGEASGDQLGAHLMASLKSLGKVRFSGIGGNAMKGEGLESLFPMEELSLMGLEIFRSLPALRKRLTQTIKTIQELQPDVVVTIDAPEFSFRVMKRLHTLAQRPRLIHYVAPTVWAWRPGRAKKISAFLDHLLCLYPCEPPYFEKHGLSATFVGHPIAEEKVIKAKRDLNLLCVLPGSRSSEIKKLLPIFKETVALICKDFPHLKVVIPTLPSRESQVRKGLEGWPCSVTVVVGDEARQEAFSHSFIALAASGTIALQLARAALPFVIAYKTSAITAFMARLLLKTQWACMVNILLQKTCIPEYIQENCTPEFLAKGISSLLKDKDVRENQQKAMNRAISMLGAPVDRAAKIILQEIPSPQRK